MSELTIEDRLERLREFIDGERGPYTGLPNDIRAALSSITTAREEGRRAGIEEAFNAVTATTSATVIYRDNITYVTGLSVGIGAAQEAIRALPAKEAT